MSSRPLRLAKVRSVGSSSIAIEEIECCVVLLLLGTELGTLVALDRDGG